MKFRSAFRKMGAWCKVAWVAALVSFVAAAQAQGASPGTPGRLGVADIGLVINMADPYSVEVGRYYIRKRGLKARQVLRLTLPAGPALDADELKQLKQRIDAHFGPGTQALALAWRQPYAVQCQSITAALTVGLDAELCRNSCAASRPSAYANSRVSKPYSELGMRLTMLLAAGDVASAKAMIDRGHSALGLAGLRGAPSAQAIFLTTNDKARNVRAKLYPPPGLIPRLGLKVEVVPDSQLGAMQRVVLAQTGSTTLPFLPKLAWMPGGLGDHLTSYGGRLANTAGQDAALRWIDAGATASHGTVSEPCNHTQKFPHPQWLLAHYAGGSSAIEAYWKSVQWPAQSLFIGDPLAAPFARR